MEREEGDRKVPLAPTEDQSADTPWVIDPLYQVEDTTV